MIYLKKQSIKKDILHDFERVINQPHWVRLIMIDYDKFIAEIEKIKNIVFYKKYIDKIFCF